MGGIFRVRKGREERLKMKLCRKVGRKLPPAPPVRPRPKNSGPTQPLTALQSGFPGHFRHAQFVGDGAAEHE